MSQFSRHPRIGLVLSGGGARGLAHIGVLKVLEREGIPIDFLAGTSMGGVIAAGYAAGLGPEFMAAEAQRMGRLRNLITLVDRSLSSLGLVEGKQVWEYFARRLGEATFDELRIPLALVAVDLYRGQEVVLRQGQVADAVRATISIPGVFSPVPLDGCLLVDGGVLNNLPVDVVREMGAEIVIAVDVSAGAELPPYAPFEGNGRFPLAQIPQIIETLKRTVNIMENRLTGYKLAEAQPEVVIRPALGGITVLGSFGRATEVIAVGEEAAVAALPQLREALEAASR